MSQVQGDKFAEMSVQTVAINNLISLCHLAQMDDGFGWREHAEFLNAWNGGLDWFLNFTNGDVLNGIFESYCRWLEKSDFGNLPFPESHRNPSDDDFDNETWADWTAPSKEEE